MKLIDYLTELNIVNLAKPIATDIKFVGKESYPPGDNEVVVKNYNKSQYYFKIANMEVFLFLVERSIDAVYLLDSNEIEKLKKDPNKLVNKYVKEKEVNEVAFTVEGRYQAINFSNSELNNLFVIIKECLKYSGRKEFLFEGTKEKHKEKTRTLATRDLMYKRILRSQRIDTKEVWKKTDIKNQYKFLGLYFSI